MNQSNILYVVRNYELVELKLRSGDTLRPDEPYCYIRDNKIEFGVHFRRILVTEDQKYLSPELIKSTLNDIKDSLPIEPTTII